MVLVQFRDNLIQTFTLPELQSLCFDLAIPFEELPGDTLSRKAQELIAYCRRRDRLPDLWERCRQLRPAVTWPGLADLLEESRVAPLEPAPTAPPRAGTVYSATIGDVGAGAQVAVGRDIRQTQSGEAPAVADLFDELRAAIRAELEPAAAGEAEARAAELRKELASAEPSLARLESLNAAFRAAGGRVARAAEAVFKSEAGQAALKTAAEIAVAATLRNISG